MSVLIGILAFVGLVAIILLVISAAHRSRTAFVQHDPFQVMIDAHRHSRRLERQFPLLQATVSFVGAMSEHEKRDFSAMLEGVANTHDSLGIDPWPSLFLSLDEFGVKIPEVVKYELERLDIAETRKLALALRLP